MDHKSFVNPLDTATALQPSADGDNGSHSIGIFNANHLIERRFVDRRVQEAWLEPCVVLQVQSQIRRHERV